MAPELQAAVGRSLVADAICRGDVDAVGKRMRPLNQLPRLLLGWTILFLLARMPADGRGIKEDLRPLQSRQPGRFGIPLVPADQDADPPAARVEGTKTKVAR